MIFSPFSIIDFTFSKASEFNWSNGNKLERVQPDDGCYLHLIRYDGLLIEFSFPNNHGGVHHKRFPCSRVPFLAYYSPGSERVFRFVISLPNGRLVGLWIGSSIGWESLSWAFSLISECLFVIHAQRFFSFFTHSGLDRGWLVLLCCIHGIQLPSSTLRRV